MTIDAAYAGNSKQIEGLADRVKWAVRNFVDDAWAQGIYFFINSGYRTYAQQLILYAQGRWRKGKRVTWTLDSNHCKGLAIDLTMLNGTYDDAEDVARIYGIHRDSALVRIGDVGHFDLIDAVPQPAPLIIDPEERLKRLQKRYEREIDADQRGRIKRQMERLQKRKDARNLP